MAGPSFEPEKALGKKLTEMDKQELCAFISDLCRTVVAEVGSRGRRGGIYPENICLDDNGKIVIGPAGKGPWKSSGTDGQKTGSPVNEIRINDHGTVAGPGAALHCTGAVLERAALRRVRRVFHGPSHVLCPE